MDKDSKQVVVLLTHPNIKESRANKALMDAISDMGEVAIYNLYEMRVEDAFNAEIWSTIISHASALVFQFPFYWMSAPSLLKRWLDEVFTYLAKTPAVAGKTLMVVTTAGSEHDAYRSGGRNRFTVDELLRPYMKGAAIADKVIGKGAAALMVLGGFKTVYADIISTPALALLCEAGIETTFAQEVPHIINRDKTGWCPLETACMELNTVEEMYPVIQNFISRIRAK